MRSKGLYFLIVLMGGACMLAALAALLNSEATTP